ncbi:MAG: hypothetical protein JSS91_01560 [Bacteroidetes bacterium]|nr:hypothetical protein [Bacteroidota bacterium]
MKNYYSLKALLTVLIFFTTISIYGQSLNLRFSTQVYSWQRADSIAGDSKTSHLRSYQNLLIDVSQNKWSLNTLIQTDADLLNKIGDGFNYRFYNLFIKGSNLFNVLDVKLGRQYLFAGVGSGAMDGLYLKLKAGKNKEYQFTAYGGSIARLDYEIKGYAPFSENSVFGGNFYYYGVRDLMANLSYVNRHKKPEPYTAIRFDSLYNPYQTEINIDSPADQLLGLDINYNYLKKYYFFSKVYYDINNRKLYRGEINANIPLNEALRFTGFYSYRQPQIRYNSIFSTFAQSENQEAGGGIDYTFKNGINIYGKISDVIYTDDNSLKFLIGFSHPSYGLAYTHYSGYSGESNGFNGYFYRQIVKEKLSVNLGLNYSSYRLGDYSTDKENAFSGLLGLTFRPVPQFSVDAQGQFITNRIYKTDTRFLLGINYWLFTKF